MTIVGGVVTMCGFAASSFANSIDTLCFTFGLIAGIGLGFVYVPAIVIVTVYFEKKRAFATGMYPNIIKNIEIVCLNICMGALSMIDQAQPFNPL